MPSSVSAVPLHESIAPLHIAIRWADCDTAGTMEMTPTTMLGRRDHKYFAVAWSILASVACIAVTVRPVQSQASPRIDSVPVLDSAHLIGTVAALAADSMEGRLAGSRGGEKAGALLMREFTRIGLQPMTRRFESPFTGVSRMRELSPGAGPPCPSQRGGALNSPTVGRCAPTRPNPLVSGVNLIGVVRGTRYPDRYIVVSAHYDHLGIKEGRVYNGADDNASGSAVILAIAEWAVTRPPVNSIIFAWFDGEEEGMVGSTEFVRRPPVPIDRIAANVNVDMVSHNWKGELFAAGARRYPVMQPLLDSVRTLGLITLRQGHDGDVSNDDWTYRSDQAPFHARGIPYIHFGNEEHADYHAPTDTFEHIYPGFFYRSARTIAEFVRLLDRGLDPVATARAR